MKQKIYKLIDDVDIYPLEIMVYDPLSDEDKPEWLTDILKFKRINENGEIEFQESRNDKGDITYQVPAINGHLNVPHNSIVAINLGNNNIFPIKRDKFSILYAEKLDMKSRIKNKLDRFLSKIHLAR
jgi:hypothetical protein